MEYTPISIGGLFKGAGKRQGLLQIFLESMSCKKRDFNICQNVDEEVGLQNCSLAYHLNESDVNLKIQEVNEKPEKF